MNVVFAGKTFNARHLETTISRTRPGDIIVLGSADHPYLFEIATVQTDCPYIENVNKFFTNVVLRDETGQKHYTRSLFGKIEVYRPVH